MGSAARGAGPSRRACAGPAREGNRWPNVATRCAGNPRSRPPAREAGPGRFAHLRRLAVGRLAVGLALAGAAVTLLVVGGAAAVQSALHWIDGQPPYLLDFRQIELDPPPPPYIKTGAAGLLKQVWAGSGRPRTLRVLELDPAGLARDFARESPWVKAVERVECRDRNRVLVRLVYRRPVAYLLLGNGPRQTTCYLDGDGVVLPRDDLDPAAAGPLIWLTDLVPAGTGGVVGEAKPGQALQVTGGRASPEKTANQAVLASIRLAAFLQHQGATRAPMQVRAIHARPRGLWIETAETVFILWGSAPGSEPSGEPPALQKWTLLGQWLEQHRVHDEVPYPKHLTFEGEHWLVKKGIRPGTAATTPQ